MGIESGVDLLLGNVNKKITTKKVRTGVENARNAGIQTVGLFMIGMPGETPEMTKETVEFAVDLDLDFAKFAITVPFPGSKLFEDRWQKDLFRDDWENYTTFNPDTRNIVIASDVQSPEQLLESLRDATFRFYMRPRLIARQLFTIRTIDARQMANGLWSLLPDLGRRTGISLGA